MFEEEVARIAELVPRGIEVAATPFRTIGDFFCFIGLMVCGGFITLWVFWKLLLCIYYNWRHRD